MKQFATLLLSAGMSRAVPPLVIGFFFLLYIGVAFFTDETLTYLLVLTSKSTILSAVLALIPLNSLLRIGQEVGTELKRYRLLCGKGTADQTEFFDESVKLSAVPDLPGLEGRIRSLGYTARRMDNVVTAAWRGFGLFPARVLFLAGTFCLFTGILISTTSRLSLRRMVIEKAIFPSPQGNGGIVERITLGESTGSILARTLAIDVKPPGTGSGTKTFGLYPPSLYGGSFVYPRYLGLALHLRFFAPDLPLGYEARQPVSCYPPGKEDSLIIPNSLYRIVFTLPEPEAGSDRYISYITGNYTLRFKLFKGTDVVFAGSASNGGEFSHDGYQLALPEIRRLVVTDFIRDYGVLFIWGAALLFITAVFIWLPVRLFFPRREMLFRCESGVTRAYSRAEGGGRRHAGVFHEALDLIDASKPEPTNLG